VPGVVFVPLRVTNTFQARRYFLKKNTPLDPQKKERKTKGEGYG